MSAITRTRQLAATATFLVLPLILATACEGVGLDQPTEIRENTFRVTDAVTLDVDTFNGRITVTSSESGSVDVRATLKRADKIAYTATQFGNGIQVKASQIGSITGTAPTVSVEISAPPNTVLILRASNGSVVVTDFDAGANIRTSNGRITLSGLSGNLEADTSNGNIEVSTFAGSAELETSNGSIRFAGRFVSGSDNFMTTSNGSITIDLDADASLEFDGATSNGSVTSEFPILATSTGRNHLEGAIGNGDAELTARTSNGSITVR